MEAGYPAKLVHKAVTEAPALQPLPLKVPILLSVPKAHPILDLECLLVPRRETERGKEGRAMPHAYAQVRASPPTRAVTPRSAARCRERWLAVSCRKWATKSGDPAPVQRLVLSRGLRTAPPSRPRTRRMYTIIAVALGFVPQADQTLVILPTVHPDQRYGGFHAPTGGRGRSEVTEVEQL